MQLSEPAQRTIRAFRVADHNSKPTLTRIPEPSPAKGEVLVAIHACALNFADLLMAKGTYQDTPPLPFTLGLEVAGEVLAHGPDTKGPPIGSRIAVFAGQGGLAETGVFPADRAVVLPDIMSFEQAAAFQVAYGTAHVALSHKARLQPGEALLVLGAAGGVGLTAVEVGKLMGARVIAVARGADKLAIAKSAGADHLIDAGDDLRTAVKALGGADVVYDPVGGALFDAALRTLNPDGRILPLGFASGTIPQIPANILLVKNISVLGLYWGGYVKTNPRIVTDSLAQLFDWFAQGLLKPHVSHCIPLTRASDGLALLRDRKSTGKVVIVP
jgi:NADPH:quinone reductase